MEYMNRKCIRCGSLISPTFDICGPCESQVEREERFRLFFWESMKIWAPIIALISCAIGFFFGWIKFGEL